jgi:hypothetical protein
MSLKAICSVAILWLLSLVVAVSVVRAQVFELPRPLPEPRIVSGADFGFRIEADQRGTPVGKLVVRVDGKWIDVQIGTLPGTRPVRPN